MKASSRGSMGAALRRSAALRKIDTSFRMCLSYRLAGLLEDLGEHWLCEAAGLGVLLAGVVAADEGWIGEEGCAVGEFVSGFAFGFEGQVSVEGDAAEDNDYLGVFEEFEFLFEVGAAVGDFFGE